MFARWFISLQVALVLAFAGPALAGERGTLSFTGENDVVSGQDRHYTNGLRIAYVTPAVTASGFETGFGFGEGTLRRSFALGQQIFTPQDIFTANPDPDDHPYAGYLFAEGALLKEDDGRWDLLTVELGIIGPWALAEETQNWFHRAMDYWEAEGWDHQMQNEAAVNFAYDWKGRPWAEGRALGLDLELTPVAGASVGTVAVNARAGGMVRVGNRLDPSFGPARIRPSLTGSGHFSSGTGSGWFAFVGVQGRVVAHDVFIDGSLFHDDGPSTEKNTFVGDMQAGLVLQLGGTQLSWTYVHRTERFRTQNGADEFGALSLSFKL